METAKHKLREAKNKTIVDRLKESALFILLIIVLMIADVVIFVNWLSTLLSSGKDFVALVTTPLFYTFVGLTGFLAVFFTSAWLIQRAAHGT